VSSDYGVIILGEGAPGELSEIVAFTLKALRAEIAAGQPVGVQS
jgi:hypothetical protein